MLRDKIMSNKEYYDHIMNPTKTEVADYIKEARQTVTEEVDLVSDKIEQRQKLERFDAFIIEVKNSLLFECVYRLYNKALPLAYVTEDTEAVRKNLVNIFIKENDVSNLIRRFESRSDMLSEWASLINKYHKMIIEAASKDEDDELLIDVKTKDKFFEELDMTDPEDVISTIRDRVADTINTFLDDNVKDKIDIELTLNAMKEKIDNANSDEMKESYNMLAKQKVNQIKKRASTNLYGYMVKTLAENTLKHDKFRQVYMTENQLDLDKISESCEIVYTFLETLNTAKIIIVDESYIKDVMTGFKKA